MPELPDLEAISKILNNKIKGQIVEHILVYRPKNLNVSTEELKKTIENQTVREFRREGKQLFLEFENGEILGFQLRLNGVIQFFKESNPHKSPVMELYFKDGTGIVLTDPRGLAKALMHPAKSKGIDAMSSALTPGFLQEKLARKSILIKNFLMDQNIIQGIGNRYSDEILWKAGISPFSICNKIPKEKIHTLSDAIKTVLGEATEQILEHHPDPLAGEILDFLLIHHPKRKTSPTGYPIRREMFASRRTYFTDEQELFI
jgi:formamidopyrimidine-DNA glycosylase